MDWTLTEHKYRQEISSLAQTIQEEIYQELLDEGWEADDIDADAMLDRVVERVSETIDGHQWVIYTAYHYQVLQLSENDGYAIQEFGADGVTTDGTLNTGVLAYGAMYADVMEEIQQNPYDPEEDDDE